MIKNSLIVSITSGVLMIIGFVSQFFLARYLSKDQYGEFQLMMSWVVLMSFFSLSGFSHATLKSTAKGYNFFFKSSSLKCFFSSLIGSLILLLIGFFLQPSRVNLFILLSIFFLFIVV